MCRSVPSAMPMVVMAMRRSSADDLVPRPFERIEFPEIHYLLDDWASKKIPHPLHDFMDTPHCRKLSQDGARKKAASSDPCPNRDFLKRD